MFKIMHHFFFARQEKIKLYTILHRFHNSTNAQNRSNYFHCEMTLITDKFSINFVNDFCSSQEKVAPVGRHSHSGMGYYSIKV